MRMAISYEVTAVQLLGLKKVSLSHTLSILHKDIYTLSMRGFQPLSCSPGILSTGICRTPSIKQVNPTPHPLHKETYTLSMEGFQPHSCSPGILSTGICRTPSLKQVNPTHPTHYIKRPTLYQWEVSSHSPVALVYFLRESAVHRP